MFHFILHKTNIAFFVFVFINFIFSVKYLSRITDYFLVISLVISLIYILIWRFKLLLKKFYPQLYLLNIFILLLFIVVSLFLFYVIPVETLNVDRWSIINSFWDTYFSGGYAYYGRGHTGNPPGPMPFYFILALPFYAIGEMGLYSLLGIFAFYFMMRYSKFSNDLQTIGIILIALSSFYLWEIVSRSNTFINAALIVFSLIYILKQKMFSTKKIIGIGVLIGLLLSTRNVFIIPYIIAFLFIWRTKRIRFKQLILLGFISLIVFIITFLPFVLGHFEDFKIINPFLIQSSFLIPFGYTVFFIVLAIFLSLLCKKNADVYFYSGITLFISISIYFLYHSKHSGFYTTYFESAGDISYFILCTPFLLYFILTGLNQNAESKPIIEY
ncbi:MAG: hypothetical protein CVU03_10665 [Bacteroidetes bacterium HGW-Bacteroidetes-2]|nr:MAG: hypothetical protein CVU03_10665 [Bacteroidetes bacterium HGW-Bacteroidetes-2]